MTARFRFDEFSPTWLLVQAFELFVVLPLLLALLPESWSRGAKVAVWIAAVIVVGVLNYLAIRHLRERREAGGDRLPDTD
jgi:hypothetical protein